jgi:UDP-N-acetyl-D-mannosaminuronate dehydrogenase
MCAFVNDACSYFDKMDDTLEVLEAAGTKWNFLPFRPSLVGGHCIGVDPWYLFKAESLELSSKFCRKKMCITMGVLWLQRSSKN